MFQSPEYQVISMKLSAVLHDLGVTENMVKMTRRTWMINEAIENIHCFLLDVKRTSFYFGSRSEASTTEGLKSDIDNLRCHHAFKVIKDWSQWQPDRRSQYMMVQDETTSPGYCLLQLVSDVAPFPAVNIPNEDHITDHLGRVLLRNNSCNIFNRGLPVHGPAQTTREPGFYDHDYVQALHCPFWPNEASLWLNQQNASGWPTENMKRYSAQQGCFVVPVGSKTGINQDLEWRISTSIAERCLMFNINITQIRCYILMKMIIKSFLKPECGEVVSSFMCKNILFHCIAGSADGNAWNECSLLMWLNQCLQTLFHCISTENCPHFLVPRNNLLAGKLSAEVKSRLTDVTRTLIADTVQSVFDIEIDYLGIHFFNKYFGLPSGVNLAYNSAFKAAHRNNHFIALMLKQSFINIEETILQNFDQNDCVSCVTKLCQIYLARSPFEKVAISLLTPYLCTSIGSMTASADIHHNQAISPEAFRWFSLGVKSDVSSSRLKLASAMYCAGDFERCEIILTAVRGQLSRTTFQTLCVCYKHILNPSKEEFAKVSYENNEGVIKHYMAFCVKYLPSEVNCIPGELRYEMFRSTKKDLQNRNREDDKWMDWAVVDSPSYLYFLQYKVYSQLKRPEDQHRALYNLATTIDTDIHLGHRETALNLLGQCMLQEGRHNKAFNYYMMSLKIRRRNNAAIWHVCILLARLFRR